MIAARRILLCGVVTLFITPPQAGWPAQAVQPNVSAPLTVEEVLKLSKAGFSEEVIITRIRRNGKPFDLTTEELVELKRAGLTDNIVRFLLDPSQPYTPPPPPAPAAAGPANAAPATPKGGPPPKKYPDDPNSARVPREPGLYRLLGNETARIDMKTVLGEKEGAGLGKILLKKGRLVGYLLGPAAKFRLTGAAPSFYFRLPEGKGIEELVLVALDPRDGRREIDMGPAGGKQELKAEAMRQFDSVEVGPGLFRLTLVNSGQGEYLFLFLGSGDPAKGSYGKGYDFGIGSQK